MKMKIRLLRRVVLDGKLNFFPVAWTGNRKSLKPDSVIADGHEVRVDGGAFYVEWRENLKTHRASAGNEPDEAYRMFLRKQAELAGAIEPQPAKLPEPPDDRRLLDSAIKVFLAKKKGRTHGVYSVSLGYLQRFATKERKKYLEDFNADDLAVSFVQFLHESKPALCDRTIANKFANVNSFFLANKIDFEFTKYDKPKVTETEPEEYSQDQLNAFFAACTPEERVIFDFFLQSGFRCQEVMFLEWTDIDFKRSLVAVTAKPHWNWTPKTYQNRRIGIPRSLTTELEKLKSRTKTKLVFANPNGGPTSNTHFIYQCKAIAKRAGLDRDEWFLHKFRATRASRLLRMGMSVKDVQKILGHKDLGSTMRYLAGSDVEQQQQMIERIAEMERLAAQVVQAQAVQAQRPA